MAHLLARIELVADRVRAAVERRRSADPDPLDRFRGLHISAAQVDSLLAERRAPLPPNEGYAAGLSTVEGQADEAERAGLQPRLRQVAGAFDLDDLEVELLLIAMAPDLDDRFERLYGYLKKKRGTKK